MSATAQWKLRRIAPRVLDALARHMMSATWMAVYQQTVGVSASAYMILYDKLSGMVTLRHGQTRSKHSRAALLRRDLRGWVKVASREIPGLRADLGSSEVPDDIINGVVELIGTVDLHEQKTGTPFEWSATMRTSLEVALEAAKKEWGGAGGAAAEVAALRAELEQARSRFEADLVNFREALENLVGRSHPDYQMLRARQIKRDDEVEDEGVPASGEIAGEGEAAAK